MANSADLLREIRDSERTCALTRRARKPDDMIRFVVGPAGEVVADLRRNLPGRGLWLTANAISISEAVRKDIFARGFKRQVVVGANLQDLIDHGMEKDLIQNLSLANKAGYVSAGAFQVEKAIQGGAIAALMHASDGSPDGARKLRQMLNRAEFEPGKVEILEILNSEQMGLALGRASVVHAALRKGPVTDALISRARRLLSFRDPAADFEHFDELEPKNDDPDGSVDGQRPGIEN